MVSLQILHGTEIQQTFLIGPRQTFNEFHHYLLHSQITRCSILAVKTTNRFERWISAFRILRRSNLRGQSLRRATRISISGLFFSANSCFSFRQIALPECFLSAPATRFVRAGSR